MSSGQEEISVAQRCRAAWPSSGRRALYPETGVVVIH